MIALYVIFRSLTPTPTAMPTEVAVAWLVLVGVALTTLGTVFGHFMSSRAQKRAAKVQAEAVQAATVAQVDDTKMTGQDRLIDQLQQELERYRAANDERVGKLEDQVQELTDENRAYRAFIGVQRDHMAHHGIPLPPWPEGLPR